MLAINTNLIVRYLTGDHPKQFLVPGRCIDTLRAAVARALNAYAGHPTVTVGDGAPVVIALGLAEKGMEFADALRLGIVALRGVRHLRP